MPSGQPDSTSTNAASPNHQARRQVPIRVNVRNHTGSPLPTPRIQVGQNGRMQLDMGRGNVVTLPLHRQHNPPAGIGTGTTNMNVRVVRLDPLTPQPVHNVGVILKEDSGSRDLSSFKCCICLEFMKEPVGCGNCSSRFCHSCLGRVVNEAGRSNSSGKPKCPTCRVELNKGLVRDETLKKEICSGHKVECSHEGCLEELLLPLVTDHENQCDHAVMKCRYATFGCTWKGKRREISNHEENECHLHKVTDLVDQFRKLRADHSTRLDIVQQQATGLVQMNSVNRQNTQRYQRKSTSNIFHLFEYCHVLSCCTPYFLYTKDNWTTFFRSHEGTAAVVNFLVFLPTVLICAKTLSFGMNTIAFVHDQEKKGVNEEEMDLLFVDAILCCTVGLLGALMLAANFADSRSGRAWSKYKISRHFGAPRLICDIVALSCFTILVSIFEMNGNGSRKNALLWFLLVGSSSFFPVMVLHLSQITNIGTAPTGKPDAYATTYPFARSFEPVYFGLRFSILVSLFGVGPTIDAAILLNFLPEERAQSKDAFFGGLPISACVAYFIVKISVEMKKAAKLFHETQRLNMDFLYFMGLAYVCILLINYMLRLFSELAIYFARRIFKISQEQVAGRSDGPQKDYHVLGMAAFGFWLCMIGLIAQF